ncbi:MAG: hypothetical protein E6Q97_32070 [Desulfurellales bacterium]|nr:MAG: hypothetical protein E6Q97_32070 [Desulfurellales bacterium]
MDEHIDTQAFGAAPDTGLTVTCRALRVVDGDTVEVSVQQVYRVRLLDCWAPESHGATKAAGEASAEHLRKYLDARGHNCVLSVPGGADVGKSWSMGRVLGHLWVLGQEKSLSEIQCEAGHACKEKP